MTNTYCNLIQTAGSLLCVALMAAEGHAQDRRGPQNPYTGPHEPDKAPAHAAPSSRVLLPWYNPIEEVTGYGEQGFYQRENGILGMGALGTPSYTGYWVPMDTPPLRIVPGPSVPARAGFKPRGNYVMPDQVWQALEADAVSRSVFVPPSGPGHLPPGLERRPDPDRRR
jgi:hypothetical protein